MSWRCRASRSTAVALLGAAILVVGVPMVVGVPVAWARTALQDVLDLFALARYPQARDQLAAVAAGSGAPGEVQLWQQWLATDPDQAADLALQIVRDRQAPLAVRLNAGIDGASLAIGRQRPDVAWQLLKPLLDLSPEAMPGEVHLLAGQALRAAGDLQRAREMLATVRPDDPAFAAARSLLGRMGLEAGDHELALNYFELAARRVDPAALPELMAGRWQALRLLGRDLEARDLAEQLLREHPESLAAMEVFEHQRREDEQFVDIPDTALVEAPAVMAPVVSGSRFTIQLAAFQDRALALQFVSRWQSEIPDLNITRALDALDQPIYRIQTGSFVSRVQAGSEARRLERSHGLEGFVTESVE